MHLLVFCADLAAGRFDITMLDDQTRMEILVDGSEACDTRDSQCTDSSDAFIDKCTWKNIVCDTDRNVTQILWREHLWAIGTVTLDFLPPKLETFEASPSPREQYVVSGTIRTALLPQDLRRFFLTDYNFSGSLDLPNLPKNIVVLNLQRNTFSGSIHLESLPATLQILLLESNALTGTLNLTALPRNLLVLGLANNAFEGSLRLDMLRPSFGSLNVSFNKLAGRLHIGGRAMPPCVSFEGLQGNSFENVIFTEENGEDVIYCDGIKYRFEH